MYKVESEFEHKGIRCVVIFGDMGYRCGYIGVDSSNKYYGVDYTDVNFGDCHGGLTYSGGGVDSNYPVVSDLWWFGFDCAHYGDGKDLKLAKEYFPAKIKNISYLQDIELLYPTNDEVVSESCVAYDCMKLADEICSKSEVTQ